MPVAGSNATTPAPFAPTLMSNLPSTINGRGRRAEVALLDPVFFVDVLLPQLSALDEIEGGQIAVGPQREDFAVGDQGSRTRAVIEHEIVDVAGMVFGSPEFLARSGIDALDDFVVVDAVKKDGPITRNSRAAPARTGFFLPENFRPALGPRARQPGFGRRAIAVRPEILRPIGRDEERVERGGWRVEGQMVRPISRDEAESG